MLYKPDETTIIADAFSRRPDNNLWADLDHAADVEDDGDDDECAVCVASSSEDALYRRDGSDFATQRHCKCISQGPAYASIIE